jgi:hypothetical protein
MTLSSKLSKLPQLMRSGFKTNWFVGQLGGFLSLIWALNQFGFNRANISLPLHGQGDELFYANVIKSVFGFGGLANQTFGYPLGQDLNYALVSPSYLFYKITSLFSFFTSNPFLGMNLFSLLTFYFGYLVLFYSMRNLGVGLVEGFVFSIIANFTYQHIFWVNQSFPILGYIFLPLVLSGLLIRLRLQNVTPKTYRKVNKKGYLNYFTLFGYVLFGVFSFQHAVVFILIFSSFLFLILIQEGNIQRIKNTFLPMALIAIGFFGSSIPSLLSRKNLFGNVSYFHRDFWASFVNSGSLVQNFTPQPGSFLEKVLGIFLPSSLQNFASFKSNVGSYPLLTEGWAATLPFAIILFLSISFHKLREFREINSSNSTTFLYLMSFALLSFLWSWSGGIGTLFSIVINPTVDAYARFAIFGIISLCMASGLLATMIRRNSKYKTFINSLLISTIFIFSYDANAIVTVKAGSTELMSNEFKRISDSLPKNCNVLQLPLVHHPWQSPGFVSYQLLLPGLLSDRKDLRWSSGAIGGSKSWDYLDKKYLPVQNSRDGLSEKMQELISDGFCGIYLDKTVWDAYMNFSPWPEYPTTPSITTDMILEKHPNFREINTSRGYIYLWIFSNSD